MPTNLATTAVRFASSICVLALAFIAAPAGAAEGVVPAGAGSYLDKLPAGSKGPPSDIFQTDAVRAKMPTNDWWSSVAWMKFSERQYPHPLAVQCQKDGLRVFYPGKNITGSKDAVFGFMPGEKGDDLILGHSAGGDFPDARVDGWSDWFVRVRFGAAGKEMTVSYGHGSPFVYALYDGGNPTITFPAAPKVWSGDAKDAVLGITINGAHYALFGPSGSTWDGVGGKVLTSQSGGKRYFSLAVLPDEKPTTLALFRKHAYAHVTDTKVSWQYDVKTAAVTTKFAFTTVVHEPGAEATLFALYPHQWRYSKSPLLGSTYPSVRGTMKLAAGKEFTTEMKFPGVLPALPKMPDCDPAKITTYVRKEVDQKEPGVKDTYWDGKWLGRQAAVATIAEQYGLADATTELDNRIRTRLEDWFTAGDGGKSKTKRVFAYDAKWGTLIGYPASYGSDTDLNDHHFHYGYFIRAAAEVARQDPKWAADDKWGGMVNLLIRDIASPDHADPLFPFLRNFDPYAGHSWASGNAKFGDGNNNESSSEAMNAWYGVALWGEATGNKAVRDLGVWLYTTEMAGIHEYWFNVHGDNFPKGYTPSVVTMVWGGKGANGTWFSGAPEAIHGINFLPITGGSLYLGLYPDYAKKNYDALVSERGGTDWKQWADILWMYRALSDPADAVKQFEAAGDKAKAEDGNSLANTYQWIYSLKALGRANASVTADDPQAVAFASGQGKTYVAYNGTAGAKVVKFSDGYELRANAKGYAVGKK